MKFGDALKAQREANRLSLRKLATTLEVDPAYLSRVESGKVPPSERVVRDAAAALKASADGWLVLAGYVPPRWQEAVAASGGEVPPGLRLASSRPLASPTALSFAGTRAIEDEGFPFEEFSDIAEVESWRKEISRPVYHLHKWWAQRLGSVFRAILLGTFTPRGSNLLELFHQPVRLPGAVVFDPFMGSGTTVGEALKLGARAIGRDINPVAHFAVKTALSQYDRGAVQDCFEAIRADVASEILYYYKARVPRGRAATVLYYFWVKVVDCPSCGKGVDLFSSYVFAQHAYSARNPEAQAVCPECGGIVAVRYNARRATCTGCRSTFDPHGGPARGSKATCRGCRKSFPIAQAVRSSGEPPRHRLYAKLVLLDGKAKAYLPADSYDEKLYEEASAALRSRKHPYPVVKIEPGYNTDQALNYCYRHWHQMFNDRQLLCLSLLAKRIRAIRDPQLRDLFACLFSGTLEFNNMFASFKGEGTGAVRHMFSHHILKPERMPLEANPWGTPKSSGAFSTLFESRILRALDYAQNPFELRVSHRKGKLASEKVYGLTAPLGHPVAVDFTAFQGGGPLYLSCGDSSRTDLAGGSVDAVVTDPPFFDNVNYSQLADFFHVWQRHILGRNGHHAEQTTRSVAEVQHGEPGLFTERLLGVWREAHRVLRPDGLLVFTYHHSRTEGWQSVLEAVTGAGFVIVAAHPIKAEMSVAAPKHQAKEPIDLDIILVCRKREATREGAPALPGVLRNASRAAAGQIKRLNGVGRTLSRNDVRVVLTAQVISRLSRLPTSAWSGYLSGNDGKIGEEIERLHGAQAVVKRQEPRSPYAQLELFSDQASS